MSLKNSENDKFILIDGNALVHRAYHAFPPTLTISKSGQQVNAVYGFSKLILDVFEKFKPKYAICAFDTKKPTIRHTQYVGYKATRKPMDSELAEQFPLVYEVVEAFNIPLYRIEGFEADDIIGTIAGMDLGDNIDKIIVSGDQDLLQLINQNTYAYLAGGSFKDSMLYDSHAVKNKFSFGPEYIVDYKSIKGDPSDNIPGVKGIGDKGAKDLINKFGHLEEIYKRIEEVDKKLQNKLIEFHEEAVMSKNLATIMTDVPLSFSLKDGLFKDFNKDKLTELFTQFEFRSLLTKIPKTQTEIDGGQASIFDTDNKVHNGNSKNKAITDQKEALVKLEKLSEAEEFAFYAVPDSEEHIDAKPIGMGFATENQEFFIAESILFESEVSSILKNLFSKTDKRKISYDIKLTLHMLKNIGITEVKAYEDVLLQSYLVAKGESRLEIKDLAFNLNGEVVLSWDELFDGKKSNQNPRMLAIERIVQFSISNAKAILKLNKKMISSIKESSKVEKLYYEIELKVARILFDMEQNGIKLNTKHLENFSGEMKADLSQLENEIYKFIGHEFNINSPKQLGDVLFGELGLPGG
ncbi:MAG TPA: DNA polymerase, partial [Candidatus Dojkabacteria bacterium]